MQMSSLYASDVPVKKFCKLAKHAETMRKNVREKSNDEYSLSIRVQTTINHISICFLPQFQRQRKHFFRARAERGIARHTDASSVVWTLIDNGKLANQIARLAAIVVKSIFTITARILARSFLLSINTQTNELM